MVGMHFGFVLELLHLKGLCSIGKYNITCCSFILLYASLQQGTNKYLASTKHDDGNLFNYGSTLRDHCPERSTRVHVVFFQGLVRVCVYAVHNVNRRRHGV